MSDFLLGAGLCPATPRRGGGAPPDPRGRRGVRLLGLLLALAPLASARAQDPAAPPTSAPPTSGDADTFDLAAAIDRALDVGVDAEEARIAVESARVALRSRRSASHPDLRLGLSGTASLGRTFSEALGRNVTEPQAQAGGRVTSSVPIWQGGELTAERRAAEAELDAATALGDQTRQDLAYTLAGALLDLEAARGAASVAEADLAAGEALRERVAALVDAGARTRADLLQQEAAVARARADLVAAGADRARAELVLVELLRLDAARSWSFVPPSDAPALAGNVDALVTRAWSARPALAASDDAVAAAAFDVRAARAGGLPSVGLTVGASSSWLSTNGDPLPTQLTEQAAAWATVDVGVPILDRGVTRDAVAQARLRERSAALDLEAARESVAVQVRGAAVDREATVAGLAAATARREAAAAAVAVLQDRYDAGAAAIAELLTARADLAAAERDLVEARVAEVRAGYALAWAVGGL